MSWRQAICFLGLGVDLPGLARAAAALHRLPLFLVQSGDGLPVTPVVVSVPRRPLQIPPPFEQRGFAHDSKKLCRFDVGLLRWLRGQS